MLQIGPALLKNTLHEVGDCATEFVEFKMFSKVGLVTVDDILPPATPELSSSICTLEEASEPILCTVCAAWSKFEVFKAVREANNAELESSLIPAMEVGVAPSSNAVPRARPMIESTELDVATTLSGIDFVLPTKWSTTARRSVSENPDISKLKSVGFALVNPFSAAATPTTGSDGEGLSTRLETVASVELLDVPTRGDLDETTVLD